MAGVTERGNVWYATWLDINGKHVMKSTKVKVKSPGRTKKQTRELAQQIATGFENASKGITELDFIQDSLRSVAEQYGFAKKIPSLAEYFANYPRTQTQQTELNRHRAFKKFVDYLGDRAQLPLNRITREDCRGFIKFLLPTLRQGTICKHREALACAFNRAVNERLISFSPMRGVCVSEEQRALGRRDDSERRLPFTIEELKIVCDPARMGQTWADMAVVSLYTGGLRLGDCCNLMWSDFDFNTDTLSLTEGKTLHVREIPICGYLKQRLLARRAMQPENEEAVFPDLKRKYSFSHGTASTEFSALLRANGIVTMNERQQHLTGDRRRFSCKSFHSLRHSVVSLLRADSTLSGDVVKHAVGHFSEAVEQRYITLSRTDHERALSVLADKLKPDNDAA